MIWEDINLSMEILESMRNQLYEEILNGIPESRRKMAPFVWAGGKGKLIRKLLPLLPDGKTYAEPFCGAASMFWHKALHPCEVLNDLDDEIINLFRCLQSEELFPKLFHKILFTPYSFSEFQKALQQESTDPVEKAWAFYVRQNQGFGGKKPTGPGDWGRSFSIGRTSHPRTRYRVRLKSLSYWHNRLMGVFLENRDALEVIRYWDSPETVFYIDPPYVPDTRVTQGLYAGEPDKEFHHNLISLLLEIEGKALVSGYDHPVYRELDRANWKRYEFKTVCHMAGKVRGSRLRGSGAAQEHAARIEVAWVKGDRQLELW